jgi:hypothetical protein
VTLLMIDSKRNLTKFSTKSLKNKIKRHK